MKIVHIIPTFNERENIGKMIDTIVSISKKFPNWKQEILIIDDYSPDNTKEVVLKYQKKYPFVHILQKKKEGLGKALVMAYEYAIKVLKADVVIPNDADFQWDPYDYPKLVKKIEEGYDVVVASRHVGGGKVIGWNWFRKLNHEVSNTALAWWIAGVHEVRDHAGNFKAIRVKNVLDKVPLQKMRNSGFSFQLHILYELSKTGAKFVEVPVTFKERKFGKSKIGLNRYYIRDIVEYVKSSLLIRYDRSQSFFRYLVVGVTGFFIQTIVSKIMVLFWINPGIAVSIGAEGAIISNFIFNNSWTFSHRKITGARLFHKFCQFNLVSLGSIVIQGAVVFLGTQLFGRESWFIFMVLSIIFIVIPYSYFVYNKIIWRSQS